MKTAVLLFIVCSSLYAQRTCFYFETSTTGTDLTVCTRAVEVENMKLWVRSSGLTYLLQPIAGSNTKWQIPYNLGGQSVLLYGSSPVDGSKLFSEIMRVPSLYTPKAATRPIERVAELLKVYPNPVNGSIIMLQGGGDPSHVQIVSVETGIRIAATAQGKVVSSVKLRPGCYFISDMRGRPISERFVVQ